MENDRAQFPFPYQPYNIQQDFMQALYSALNQGKVGIFESPTGTVCMPLHERNDQCVSCFTSLIAVNVCYVGEVTESDMWSTELAHRL